MTVARTNELGLGIAGDAEARPSGLKNWKQASTIRSNNDA